MYRVSLPLENSVSMSNRIAKLTHIRSTFVRTPIVLAPSGSTSRANLSPSLLAKSVFAEVTAKMIALGFVMYFKSMSLICRSISRGWSPTGTFVRPGKSTSVSVRTFGEKMRRLMGRGERPGDANVKRQHVSGKFFKRFCMQLPLLTLVLARLRVGISDDLLPNLVEVVELLSGWFATTSSSVSDAGRPVHRSLA